MSFNLSAPPPPITPTPRRQRVLLLAASSLVHVLVLVPVALNTVFVPSVENDDPAFEVLIDMPRDFVRPEPKPVQQIPAERVAPEAPPQPVPQDRNDQPERIEQIEAARPQPDQRLVDTRLPDLAPPRPEAPRETLASDSAAAISDLDVSALPTLDAPVTRPVIEAIDGPAADSQPLSEIHARVPSLRSATQADRAGEADQNDADALDAPVPRRARLDEEAEAALAAAAAQGALDDAWTYRPEAGAAGGGGGRTGGAAGASGGPDGHNTATRTGRIYYGGSTTPVDCTQPQMLSDVQRLSCDSAEQRRIRDAVARGVRVQGSGNTERDAYMRGVGDARLRNYEALRSVHGGTGTTPIDTSGSGRGEILDEMSGTNREVRKLQQQIGASNGPRAPSPDND